MQNALPPLQFDEEDTLRILPADEEPVEDKVQSRVKSELPPLSFDEEEITATPVKKMQSTLPSLSFDNDEEEVISKAKDIGAKEDTRTFSRGLARGYEESSTVSENFGDWLESKFPMGRFVLTPKRILGPLWGGQGPYISPEEAYGQDFMQLNEDQRRERLQQLKKEYIAQKYPEFEGQEDRTWGEVLGGVGGSMMDPSTLAPIGQTYKAATAIGAVTGFAYGTSEGLAKEGKIDPVTTAAYTGAGAVLAPGMKYVGDKVVSRFVDGKAISSNEASDFVDAYQGVIYERRAMGESPREAFDYANGVFRVSDKTLTDFTNKAEKKIYVPKQDEAQLYIDLVNFNQTGKAPVKAPGKLSSTMDEVLGVLSTRVKNISVPMWHRLRKLDYNQHSRLHNLSTEVNPFLKNMQKLPKDVKDEFDRALLNGNFDSVESAIKASGNKEMMDQFTTVKSVLNDLYKEAKESGIELGFRENYFPRYIKNLEGLRNALGKEENIAIEKLWEDAAKKKGTALSITEKADIVNKYVRGYPTTIGGGTPFAKARTIEEIPPELMQFYATPEESLQHYIRRAVNEIEKRHFFGRNWTKNELGSGTNIDDSIGAIVAREVEAGNVDPRRADELRDLLMTRFGPGEMGTGEGTQTVKNLLYMQTLGNPLSAATQLGDTFLATYKNGIKPVIDSFLKKEKIRLKDYGFTEIAEEVSSNVRTAKWLQFNFKWVGFSRVDRLGKETLLNGSLNKYTEMVKDPKQVAKFRQTWKKAYGDDVDNLIADLQTGKLSDDVKLLLWHDLADMQPVALSEMPAQYLKMNKGRIFYMLKTFTLKQFDIIRRDIVQQIRKPGSRKEGVKNLAKYIAAFQAGGMSSDAIKAWMQGREYDPGDSVIENFWKMMGVNRYTVGKASDKPFETAADIIMPPVNIWDSIVADIKDLVSDDVEEIKGKSVKAIPGVGRLIYEHQMGGKEEYKEKQREEKLKEMGFAKGGMLDQSRRLFRRGGYLRTRKGYAEGGEVEEDRDPLSVSDVGVKRFNLFEHYNPNAVQVIDPNEDPEYVSMEGIDMSNKEEAQKDLAEFGKDMIPVYGEIRAGERAIEEFNKGNYGTAALEAAGAIPLVGMGVRAIAKGAKLGKEIIPEAFKRIAVEAPNDLPGFYGGAIGQGAAIGKGFLKMVGNTIKTSLSPSAFADFKNFGFGAGMRDVLETNVKVINENQRIKNILTKKMDEVGEASPDYERLSLQLAQAKDNIQEAEKVIVGQLGYNANIARQMGIDSPVLSKWSDRFNKELLDYNPTAFKNSIEKYSVYGKGAVTKNDVDYFYDQISKAWDVGEGDKAKMVVRSMATYKGRGGDFRQDIFSSAQGSALRKFFENGVNDADSLEAAIKAHNDDIANQLSKFNKLEMKTLPEAAALANRRIVIKKKEGNNLYIAFSKNSSSKTEGGVNVQMKINPKKKEAYAIVSDEHDLFGKVPPGSSRLITVTPIQRMDELLDPTKVYSGTKTERAREAAVAANEEAMAMALKAKEYKMPEGLQKVDGTKLEKAEGLTKDQVKQINDILSTRSEGQRDILRNAVLGSTVYRGVTGGEEEQGFAEGGMVEEADEATPLVQSMSRRIKADENQLRSDLETVKQAIKKHESGNQNIYQISKGMDRGPAAGYYQFEQKQYGGSGAAKTAVNRTLNSYKMLKQPAPQWLQQLAKDPDPDFTLLDERQQDVIFLGNLNQEKGSDRLLKNVVTAKDEEAKKKAIEDLWRKAHKKVNATEKFRW